MTTKPKSVPAPAAASSAKTEGRLEWRPLLKWLLKDGLIDEAQALRTEQRLGAGDSSLHPLVRLGHASLVHLATGKPLDVDALAEWLAVRAGMPYLRIDPLKVDVGRVGDVMSIGYAEAKRCLPVQFGLNDVTIATSEPFDTGWVAQIESHVRKPVKLVIANPLDIARYTTEFFTLARSVRAATKAGEQSQVTSFEQLVELGKSTKQLDANDQGVVQVVDWLWQYAFDQRASDIHLEPRREMGVIRFRIDGVLHTVYQLPPTVMSAMTSRIKLLGRM
ncbi:MAG: type II/IV secretion system protein, partial [Rubrivivax sp.]